MTAATAPPVAAVFERYRDRPFLVDTVSGRTLTYGAFEAVARGAAGWLAAQGVGRGDRVGLLLENSVEFVALYFGCLFRGAVAVPVNPSLHRDTVAYVEGHARLRVLVHSDATRDAVPDAASTPTARVDGSTFEAADPLPVDLDGLDPDALFAVTYTSGTTSHPKGVAHRAGRLLGCALAFSRAQEWDETLRLVHTMPMAYMAGLINTLLCPFVVGGCAVLLPAFGARSALGFWGPVIEHRANALWLAPTMLSFLLRVDRGEDGPAYCADHVHTVCVGTAPLPARVRDAFEARYGTPLMESYGLSELLFVTTQRPGGTPAPSVGRPLPGVGLRVVDGDGQDALEGDVLVRTPYAMEGYLDAETSEPVRLDTDLWFPTGDVGTLGPDGALTITGRKKDLIIKGGANVSPRAVEDVVGGHPSVLDAAVVGVPHDFYGEDVVAVVELREGHALDEAGVKARCRERLEAAMVPSSVVAIDSVPRNATGKVEKGRLREWLLSR